MSESETDAYCPSCEQELTPSQYDMDGCDRCGTEDVWLSPTAFLRVVMDEDDPGVVLNDA